MSTPAFTCPLPTSSRDTIVLGHGSGGKLSNELTREIFLQAFFNPLLAKLDDQAVIDVSAGKLALTTDTFVVKPLFFPGGDIGSLAVFGTVNDLAMGGAKPLYLSIAFVLEEGLPIDVLRRIAESAAAAAERCGVAIITGDTKVVERGKGDGVFINTTGIGAVREGVCLSANQARPGDLVILSGPIGDHGIAILAQREGLELEGDLVSDSAPLHEVAASMIDAAGPLIRCMRDPTRGGVSSTLNEIASQSGVGVILQETEIPVRDEVAGACELLGLDPLYVANEGRLVAIVSPDAADRILEAMRAHAVAAEARVIGKVVERDPGLVRMRTAYGTTRIVDMLPGDQLPRIC